MLGSIWTPRFRRNLNDWEFGELIELLRILDGRKLDLSLKDSWEWTNSATGCFSTKSLYMELVSDRSFFPSKVFGTGVSPLECCFSFGRLFWIKFSPRIIFEESVTHLLMHCDMATTVWGFFLSHLKISWVFLNHFHELISGWWIRDWEALPSIIWTALPGAIGWGLWNERNARIFYDRVRSKEELILSIYRGLFDWCSIRDEFSDRE